MNIKYTLISPGANTNGSATEKSHPFLYTSGSKHVISFVNKNQNTAKNVLGKCKIKLPLMLQNQRSFNMIYFIAKGMQSFDINADVLLIMLH